MSASGSPVPAWRPGASLLLGAARVAGLGRGLSEASWRAPEWGARSRQGGAGPGGRGRARRGRLADLALVRAQPPPHWDGALARNRVAAAGCVGGDVDQVAAELRRARAAAREKVWAARCPVSADGPVGSWSTKASSGWNPYQGLKVARAPSLSKCAFTSVASRSMITREYRRQPDRGPRHRPRAAARSICASGCWCAATPAAGSRSSSRTCTTWACSSPSAQVARFRAQRGRVGRSQDAMAWIAMHATLVLPGMAGTLTRR